MRPGNDPGPHALLTEDLLLAEMHMQFEGFLIRATACGAKRDLHPVVLLASDLHPIGAGIGSVVIGIIEDDDVLAVGEPRASVRLDNRDVVPVVAILT